MSYFDDASLVMIPSGYKEDKVYSVKPIDGSGDLDFTRASSATRIGPTGLIEKTRTNNLLQSNNFNTTWTITRASFVSGQSGYDGTNDAWSFVDTTDNSTHLLYQPLSSLGASVATMSVYAKKGAVDFLAFRFEGATVDYAYFDLANGILGTIDSDYIEARITSVGGGWYRCEATRLLAASGNQAILLTAQTDNDPTYAGAGTTAVYIQDAQVEQGLVATSYIETTTTAVTVGSYDNVPRLNYTAGSTSSCPSLLLEPQRTNLYLFSEPFQNEGSAGGVTYENFNWAIGFVNCIKFGDNSTTRFRYGGGVAASTEYTLSAFVIMDDLSEPVIGGQSSGNDFTFVLGGDIHSNANPSVNMGNNIWRVSVTATTTASPNSANNGIIKFDTQSSKGFRVVGLQVEAGSYATSYIPTYGATVTRVVDACSKTGISGLIGSAEGVLYIETNALVDVPATSLYISLSKNGEASFNNSLVLQHRNNGFLRVYANGTATNDIHFNVDIDFTQNHKIAVLYKLNGYKLFIDGVAQNLFGTPTQAVFSGLDNLSFDLRGASNFNGNVKKTLVFNTTLTDTQLAELTS